MFFGPTYHNLLCIRDDVFGHMINGGGMGAMGAAIPMNAGHQMDLHHLYEMVVELTILLNVC
jgi:hypothetical protein